MVRKQLSAAVLALCLAACAAQPPPPAAAPAPPAAPPAPMAVAPPPVASDARVASHRWNVERVRCSDLLGASDEDRAAAAMFYFGYLAAKAGIHIVDVSRIDDNIAKVMRQCAAAPNLTVPQAFLEAVRLPAHG
jgi:HdeA/HdeB family